MHYLESKITGRAGRQELCDETDGAVCLANILNTSWTFLRWCTSKSMRRKVTQVLGESSITSALSAWSPSVVLLLLSGRYRMRALIRSLLSIPLRPIAVKPTAENMAAQPPESVLKMRELIAAKGAGGW